MSSDGETGSVSPAWAADTAKGYRRLLRWILVSLMCLTLVAVALAALEAFDVLGGVYRVEVDVNTGRIRARRFVLGEFLSEAVYETEFSKLLRKLSLASGSERSEWRLSNSYGKGVLGLYEPLASTDYQGAFGKCEFLAKQVGVGDLAHGGKEVVSEFLELLKTGDDSAMLRRLNEMYSGSR